MLARPLRNFFVHKHVFLPPDSIIIISVFPGDCYHSTSSDLYCCVCSKNGNFKEKRQLAT